MIRHLFSLVCRRYIQDALTGNSSFIDCVDSVHLDALPELQEGSGVLIPVDVQIVSHWTRDDLDTPERGRARLRLAMPNGSEIPGMEFPIDLSEKPNNRVITPLPLHPCTGPGRYWHVIDLQRPDGSWAEVTRIPVAIDIGPPSSHEEPPNPPP